MIDVMEGHGKASSILRAATAIRYEVCGPPAQRIITASVPSPAPAEDGHSRNLRELAGDAAKLIERELARMRLQPALSQEDMAALNSYSKTLLQQAESQEKLLTERREAVAALSDEELVRETEKALEGFKAKTREPGDEGSSRD